MRLRRIFVDGLPPSAAKPFSEFMLFHGVSGGKIIDRPEIQKLEVVFTYAHEARQPTP